MHGQMPVTESRLRAGAPLVNYTADDTMASVRAMFGREGFELREKTEHARENRSVDMRTMRPKRCAQ